MKSILHIFILCILLMPLFPAAQSWSWETTFPNSTLNDMKTLPSGTTYLVGDFKQVTPKDSASAEDYFLIKVDSSGNIIGGFKKGTEDLGIGQLLGIDNEGNVYVLGTPFVPVANNYYLHKYTVDGSPIWARKFYVEGGIKAMDVNYGRIGLTGHYKKVMLIYDFDNVKVTKSLGVDCDPEWEYPCAANKFDAFVVNLDYNGAFVWADNYYTQMKPGYYADYAYPYTKIDSDDYGLDVAIDKNQNTIFSGVFSYNSIPFGDSLIIGNLKLYYQDIINFPPLIAKINPDGQALWAQLDKQKGIKYVNPNKRVATDINLNIYEIYEYLNIQAGRVNITMKKRKPNGTLLWERKIIPEDPNYELENWTWYSDIDGNHYVQAYFSDADYEHIFIKIDNQNQLIHQFENAESFAASKMGVDEDEGLYFQSGNTLKKYILRDPVTFIFVGNGLWSNPENWENDIMPPLTLPKWDTIYIRTTENDSCVLDVQQVIPEGALLMVAPGSRFIVPLDILSEPILPNPTPIIGTSLVNPAGKASDTILFKVKVIPGDYPSSFGIETTIDLTSIGGHLSQLLNDLGIEGDEEEGDSVYSYAYVLPDTVTPGSRMVPFKVTDAQMRADSGEFVITVLPTPQPEIVISQIYTSGGVSGATYQKDFIELFNRGVQTVSLDGKSVQLASGTGTDLFSANPPILLSGTLAPGQYYLISLAGGANGVALPQADVSSGLALADAGGKIILVDESNGLPCNGSSTPCVGEQMDKILDLVGYGNANFFETKAVPVAIRPRLTVYLRNWEGVQDTQNNSLDFFQALPTPRNKNAKMNPAQSKVVISQVYTAGGGTYKNDFIELYNDGNKAQSLFGWSIQYAEAGASNWQSTPLDGALQPGQFLLISEAAALTGSNLPAVDIQGNIDMNTTGGTVLLVKTADAQTGNCPTGEQIADKIGYGNATCYEGSGPTSATSIIRRQHSGGLDTDDNQNDIRTGPLYPRNRSFPIYSNHYRNGESVLVDTRDNKTYPVKRIGQKIWTLSNLNFNQTGSKVYDNNAANEAIYGRLYNWDQAKAALPSGWQLPERTDWIELKNFVGFGGELKDTLFWQAPNTGGNNASGFSARPGGYNSVYFEDLGLYGVWWTNTQVSQMGSFIYAYSAWLGYMGTAINTDWYDNKDGYWYSVRCIKN